MTAAATFDAPGAVADLAAEAVRVLNHLTLVPPSVGTPGWSDVADLYEVMAGMCILIDRLPQLLDQLTCHLARPIGDGYRCDSEEVGAPAAVVANAVESLTAAVSHIRDCGADLVLAQSAVAHLAPV